MVVSEIIKTCSHEKIAKAAVASIGRDFSNRVSAIAGRQGLDAGEFAARVVRNFGREAGAGRRWQVEHAVTRTDMPLLHGLRLILEEAILTTPH